MGHHQLQADARIGLFLGQATQQRRNLAEVAAAEQVVGAGLDNISRRFSVASLYRMAHGLIEVAMLAEPGTGAGMQAHQALLRLCFQACAQHLAQQRMQAVPGFTVVTLDLSDEQVVAVQAGQLGEHPRNGMGLAEQRGAQ
ncbi:hypothetical protein D9M71_759870 [compost metagenome]